MWLCVYRADERGREAERYRLINFFSFFHAPPLSLHPSFLDELSMLWSNQYAGARFKVGITASLPADTWACNLRQRLLLQPLLSCAVLGNMSVHLNPVSAGNARRKRRLQGEHRRICLCLYKPLRCWACMKSSSFPPLSPSASTQTPLKAVCKHSNTRPCKPAIDWKKTVDNDIFWI